MSRIPLGRLIAVTGVSGSGKSTLARDVLHDNLSLRGSDRGRDRLQGDRRAAKHVERVLEVDQTPIGKTPRSCPATYVGFWDDDPQAVRRHDARRACAAGRASRFSFNTAGGRCEGCEGQGMQEDRDVLPARRRVACEACGGARFNPETLQVQLRGKTIGEVLAMSVDEAVEFFAAHPVDPPLPAAAAGRGPRLSHARPAEPDAVGRRGAAHQAGRPSSSKVREPADQQTLYVLDEPTVGLHMADVEKLIRVLHRLVDAGNTVVVIEHNLDVIAEADWIIDLGPEGGGGGGAIVYQGVPEGIRRRAHRCRAEKLPRRAQGGMTRGAGARADGRRAGAVEQRRRGDAPHRARRADRAGVLAQLLCFCLRLRVSARYAGKTRWKAVRAAGLPGLFSGMLWAVMFTAFVIALSLTTTANALVVMSIAPAAHRGVRAHRATDPIPLRTWFAALAAMAASRHVQLLPSTM